MSRRFAVLAAALAALAAPLVAAAPASASGTTHIWMQEASVADIYAQTDGTVASYIFDNSSSYGYGNSDTAQPVEPYSATTPALRYTSYAQFASDIQSGVIGTGTAWPPGSVVIYDLEGGSGFSPPNEQESPETYMPMFNHLAVENGFEPVDTPGLDLGDTDTTCMKTAGEDNATWYETCDIASYAVADGALGLVVQAQSETATESTYTTLCKDAKADASQANSSAFVLDEVSVNYGTPLQATDDLQNMGKANVDGVFIQGSDSDAGTQGGWEDTVLTTLDSKGW
jgi:hypothetical protein